jgi:hypothetical protein
MFGMEAFHRNFKGKCSSVFADVMSVWNGGTHWFLSQNAGNKTSSLGSGFAEARGNSSETEKHFIGFNPIKWRLENQTD